MKNLSVRAKIFAAFLVVLVLIAVILISTIITSISRNDELVRGNEMNNLKSAANKLLDNFNLARVEIRTLFTSIDAQEEHDIALSYLDICSDILKGMEKTSDSLDGYMAEDIRALEAMFAKIHGGIVAVGEYDDTNLTFMALMQQSGEAMSAESDFLFSYISERTLQISRESSQQAIDRIDNVMIPVHNINSAVDRARILANSLITVQDTSVIPELNAALDDVDALADSIRPHLTTDQGRAALAGVTSAAEDFRASIAEVQEHLAATDVVIAQARATIQELIDLVGNYVDTITLDVAAVNQAAIDSSRSTMVVLIAICSVVAFLSALMPLLLGQMITGPLGKMKNVLLQAGGSGNLHFSDATKQDVRKAGQSKDEIGQSVLAFTKFIDHVIELSEVLERIADKDLSVNVSLLSDEDSMGLAIKRLVDNLNDIFYGIHGSTAQVATAAREIASGAQGLAQGSTEQASTVQEISASLSEINEQMNRNTQTVQTVVTGSADMSLSAQEGNKKMRHMTSSMQEIAQASQAIGGVIKLIDDIAFQTNILSLNAAVEAARAGEHGKGFNVVANEVRTLAGKSAVAAKETSALISTSIQKAEQGLSYVKDTAESLNEIIEGIKKNEESLRAVTHQNDDVTNATAQVSIAIDQVAQVVQNNSATSQQSAAASEELSGQAQMLQAMIEEFRLKERNRLLPAQSVPS